ncbi:MAG: IS1380 family transposase [Bacillota bacterium]|nr:IS1380 family transposase [Bacillota bacterium]
MNRQNKILPAKFDNTTVTGYASLGYLENFKQKIGFRQLLESGISYNKYHNARFTTADTLKFMVDATIQGFSRFNHMDELRRDNAYLKLKGQDPSEKVCRDLLLNLPARTASELRLLNKQLLARKAQSEGCRSVVLNIDDTVCTVYGDQEGAGVGYNPKKNGRQSFKEKVGILASTNEVINLTLENGKHHTNFELEAFIHKCRLLLPEQWHLTRVRIGCGGFDIDNLSYLDEKDLEFVIKCKKYAGIWTIIRTVNSKPHLYPWTAIVEMFSVNEIQAKLPKWEKTYRFVLVRKPVPAKNDKQIKMAGVDPYEYQVIVTNIDNLTAEEIFHEYNQRCDIENKIDELKDGFAFDQNSQRNKKCNELFLLMKMLAYNIHNWFKSAILPEGWIHYEIQTIRRKFYHLAANICGQGRYRHIRYACDQVIAAMITVVIDRLRRFQLA